MEDAISHIRPHGRIICFGNSSGAKAAFDMFSFFGAENASVETFFSYRAFVQDKIELTSHIDRHGVGGSAVEGYFPQATA